MIILLPYPSFEKSAEVFDRDMLTAQVACCKVVIDGKANYQMWDGCIEAVKLYSNVLVQERSKRRYDPRTNEYEVGEVIMPKWFGWSVVHRSHRSYLLAKAYFFYKKFNWPEIPSDNLYFP